MIISKTKKCASKPSGSGDMPDMPPFLMPVPDDGTKVIESEFYTLFVTDEDPIHKEFQINDDGEEFTAIREIVPKHKKYTLYISEFGHTQNQLHKIMYELRKAIEHDVLEIRIASDGGYVSEGITLYNTMRELFNGRTFTYLDSTGFSMGAMLFSLGDQRISYEDSSLMFHNYSSGYFGKGQELKSYIDFEDKHFDEFFSKKIVNKGFLSAEEYSHMKMGKDFWFDSYELAKRGICTHVIVSGFRLDNEAFIEYHDQDKDIDEWVVAKLVELQEDGDEDSIVEELPTKPARKTKAKPA
jgi:ATP-dependent protease ClpP protease subunit